MKEGSCIADVLSGTADWHVAHCDSRFALAGMPDCCVDAIHCDPPYELGFMGKKWDRSGIAFDVEFWRQCLRVLKPGGHLFAFGGSRTYHRVACAIEDAGFEIRDSIFWCYGQGFPKSVNVSLSIDKKDGVKDKREIVHSYEAGGNAGTSTKDKGGTYVTGAPNSDPVQLHVTRGATEKSRKWDGFGTALRPSHEPIVMARKPVEGTVIENVMQYGTGALNIDACRTPTDWNEPDRPESWKRSGYTADAEAEKIAAPPGTGIQCHPGGRWPANVVFDSDAASSLAKFSKDQDPRPSGWSKSGSSASDNVCMSGRNYDRQAKPDSFIDAGGTAARFFPILDFDPRIDAPFLYSAKASTKEREAGLSHFPMKSAGELTGRKDGSAGLTPRAGAGRASKGRRNLHATVKPVSVLAWHVRLGTPPGGIVLDPFAGVASCGIAATLQGFRYVGIEADFDQDGYVEIGRARIRHWLRQGVSVPTNQPANDARQTELFGNG